MAAPLGGGAGRAGALMPVWRAGPGLDVMIEPVGEWRSARETEPARDADVPRGSQKPQGIYNSRYRRMSVTVSNR